MFSGFANLNKFEFTFIQNDSGNYGSEKVECMKYAFIFEK